jgi:hypothetical protein
MSKNTKSWVVARLLELALRWIKIKMMRKIKVSVL